MKCGEGKCGGDKKSATDEAKDAVSNAADKVKAVGMGMLMKGQVASMSDDDIKAVAAYIAGL